MAGDIIRSRLEALVRGMESEDSRRALATVLFMVMPVDGETHPRERSRLQRILQDQFELDETAVAQLVQRASGPASDSRLQDALSILKRDETQEELVMMISHMWEMVFADGRVHEMEVLLVERVGTLLDLPTHRVAQLMNH